MLFGAALTVFYELTSPSYFLLVVLVCSLASFARFGPKDWIIVGLALMLFAEKWEAREQQSI
jgi:hypothetical protein